MSNNATGPQGELVMRTIAMPKDTNALGDIFGGWLVSQMDLGAGIIAKNRAQSRAATVAIEKLHFINPVHVGNMVSCYGKILKVGRTSMTIQIEAWITQPDHCNSDIKVVDGLFTFVAIDDDGKPHLVDRN